MDEMEAPPSDMLYCDDDKQNLEQLLEAFGSVVSLEDIASAYCQADRNVYAAGKILCNLQGSTSSTSTSVSKDELEDATAPSECSSDTVLGKSHADRHSTAPKTKMRSVSMGSVSGVIGAEYARSWPLTKESCKVTKPLKLMSSEFPVSEIWDEKVPPDFAARSETMHRDVEEFLFTMLGNGFKLDMNVIREVLGLCGYDLRMCMEKLLDISASTLEKSDDILSIAAQTHMEKCRDLETLRNQENSKYRKSAGSDGASFLTRSVSELPKRDEDRYNLQREVLNSLFSVPERFEEAPRRILPKKEARRSRAFGYLVTEPLIDTITEGWTVTAKPKVNGYENEETEEDSYEVLRKAVKEYWITMKEYYKAAADAYAKGDHARAYKFLEEGHFFMKKARETDEKSTQILIETREDEEIISLDLHDHEPKEAIRLLKFHLTSLSGIPSIQYLKVIVGANDDDTKDGARKRLITKLLERDSIKWTDEGSGRIMLIRIDEINPKRLSYAKKSKKSAVV